MKAELPELSEFQNALLICLDQLQGHERHCSKNALIHLEKAYKIKDIDPEMAAFHAIASEEEIVAALFYVIKRRNYQYSDKLSPRNHIHKNAVYLYLMTVRNALSRFEAVLPDIDICIKEVESKKQAYLRLKLKDEKYAIPEPPLNFTMKNANGGKLELFNTEFENMAKEFGKKELLEYLRQIANMRNVLLYASDDGINKVGNNIEEVLKNYQKRVFTLITILCLVFPYRENALFVQQMINGFLVSLGSIDEKNIEW